MTDNRQDIYDRTAHATNAMIAGRASASGFHASEARTAYQQARADLDAILTDLDTLAPDTGAGAGLAIAPFPAEFRVHQGEAFSYQFGAIGGTGPYRFMRLSGTIPLALTLTEGGLLSGTVQMFPPGSDFVIGLMDVLGTLVTAGVWIHVID